MMGHAPYDSNEKNGDAVLLRLNVNDIDWLVFVR